MRFLALLFLLPSIASAADIYIHWTAPETREDGSQIESLDGYNVYYSIDNGFQSAQPVADTNFLLENVSVGLYTIQVTAIEGGLESEKSSPVTVRVTEVQKAKPGRVVITVDFVNCDDCGLELQ